MAAAAQALRLPLLSLRGRVVFPKCQLRLQVNSSSTLQLLKDVLWDIQSSARVDPHKLCVAVFTCKPSKSKPSSHQEQQQESVDALYEIGTMARIVQITRVQDGLSVLLQGVCRVRRRPVDASSRGINKNYHIVHVERLVDEYQQLKDQSSGDHPQEQDPQAQAQDAPSLDTLMAQLKRLAKELLHESSSSSAFSRNTHELLDTISTSSSNQASHLADLLAHTLPLELQQKQQVLETLHVPSRCAKVLQLVQDQKTKWQLARKIQHRMQQQLDNTRREFLLRQQLDAINKELRALRKSKGKEHVQDQEHDQDEEEEEEEEAEADAGAGAGAGADADADGDGDDDLQALAKRLRALQLGPKAERVVQRELHRLQTMSPAQPEYAMLLNYLEFVAELPWTNETQDSLDIDQVQHQLEQDHYALDNVKKRIVEYIAVRSLHQDMKGPILCLVGPPGVGKTSLGKSIACATKRNFERIALGGVHDESEIRGHRKTYVGAMAGRILNALRHAESKNPVLLLDEIDKLGKDFRGDPASALLEVLDPHQNHTFTDHFLNTPFDLSKVLFVATANRLEGIPSALRDRMEVIEVSGYSVEQKLEIAKRYLISRQIQENGLEPNAVRFSHEVLHQMIVDYTREAGVRELERVVASVCRHVAVGVARMRSKAASPSSPPLTLPVVITKDSLTRILGPKLVFNEVALRTHHLGVVTGMSWSSVGGSILFVEASCARKAQVPTTPPAKANVNALPHLQLTGKLGEVMKESAQLALSWLRVHAPLIESTGDDPSRTPLISLRDISHVHVHFPEGAIPKDGPSAGTAILCALISAMARVPAPIDLAMTGEITLRGVILPVGGIRDKVLAAIRAGIKRVVLPEGNRSDAQELIKELQATCSSSCPVEFVFVQTLSQLIHIVFAELHVRDDDTDELQSMEKNKKTIKAQHTEMQLLPSRL